MLKDTILGLALSLFVVSSVVAAEPFKLNYENVPDYITFIIPGVLACTNKKDAIIILKHVRDEELDKAELEYYRANQNKEDGYCVQVPSSFVTFMQEIDYNYNVAQIKILNPGASMFSDWWISYSPFIGEDTILDSKYTFLTYSEFTQLIEEAIEEVENAKPPLEIPESRE